MNLKSISKEELENMSYDDIAFAILTEKKKKMKIIDLFKEIGKLIHLPESVIEDKIGDFFEMLTLDKRFIMLDDGSWDLKTRHAGDVIIEDDEEDISVDEIDEMDEEEEPENDEIFYDETDDDDTDDDLKDLVVMSEDDEEDSML